MTFVSLEAQLVSICKLRMKQQQSKAKELADQDFGRDVVETSSILSLITFIKTDFHSASSTLSFDDKDNIFSIT